jgi:hypothetical protein
MIRLDDGMDSIAENMIRKHLEEKEILLWAGRPYRGVASTLGTIFQPLFFIGIGIMLLIIPPRNEWRRHRQFFFGILALITGVGVFLVEVFRRQPFYGLTNERLIILIRFAPWRIQSYPLGLLANLSLEDSERGLGNITFDRVGTSRGPLRIRPLFYQIRNAREVYDLICKAQRDWKRQF